MSINNFTIPKLSMEMTPSLPELPAELVEEILVYLEDTDLHSFRLVCRNLNQKSTHHCSVRLFHTWTTNLSRKSLEFWGKISEISQIVKNTRVFKLVMSPPLTEIGQGFAWDIESSENESVSLPGLEIIQRILNRMPMCKSFIFTSWRSPRLPLEPTKDSRVPSDPRTTIWDIIVDRRFTSLELDLKKRSGHHVDAQWWCCESGELKPKVHAAWGNLTNLTLRFSKHVIKRGHSASLPALLAAAVNLEALNMSIVTEPIDLPLIDWLYVNGAYPKLQHLTLMISYVRQAHIFGFLLRHAATLRSANLSLTFLDQSPTWEPLLALLRDNFPLLHKVAFKSSYASRNYPKLWFEGFIGKDMLPWAETLVFKTQAHGTGHWAGLVSWVSYEGHEMQKALDLIRLSHVEKNRPWRATP
jgi:hypothetical protein